MLWVSVIVLCFVVRYFMSILVLQSSRWGRVYRAGFFALFVFLVSCDCCVSPSSQCHRFVFIFCIVVFPDHNQLLFLSIITPKIGFLATRLM